MQASRRRYNVSRLLRNQKGRNEALDLKLTFWDLISGLVLIVGLKRKLRNIQGGSSDNSLFYISQNILGI
jgi:hypothetical protein